jgi:hypothetical protein
MYSYLLQKLSIFAYTVEVLILMLDKFTLGSFTRSTPLPPRIATPPGGPSPAASRRHARLSLRETRVTLVATDLDLLPH